MEIFFALFAAGCFLAYTNGANDNFKGVATLLGSRTSDYKTAISWSTLTTLAGSLCSLFWAQKLLQFFSGNDLVPDAVAASPEFLTSVGLGAAMTVLIATLTGWPVSTTHAITGGLVGAGVMAAGSDVNLSVLGGNFFLPLLISPLVAVVMSAFLYAMFRMIRVKLGFKRTYCICVGQTEKVVSVAEPLGAFSLRALRTPEIKIASQKECRQQYEGRLLGIPCQKLLDSAHFLSAGLVSFARGLNDTPKIVALLLVMPNFSLTFRMFLIVALMALGGLLNARKVAATMSHRITPMNHGQGFTANLVTGFLVIFASPWGWPVSTTHASCGSLFGIGAVTGKGHFDVISKIIMAWVLTLPLAAVVAGSIYILFSK